MFLGETRFFLPIVGSAVIFILYTVVRKCQKRREKRMIPVVCTDGEKAEKRAVVDVYAVPVVCTDGKKAEKHAVVDVYAVPV